MGQQFCRRSARVLSGTLFALAFVSLARNAGAQIPVGQLYSTACNGTVPPDPLNPSLWSPWSSTATWGGPVPTSGNVTIKCGQYVLLDVSNLVLYKLNITGALLVANGRTISLTANFIFVFGYFFAGHPTAPYTGKFTITLTTPPNNVSDPAVPWLGFKTLAVQGGNVVFNGMPGGGATNAWGRLSGTIPVGANSLILDRSPAGWPVGAQVVIASTDFDVWQSEVVTITAVNTTSNRVTFVPPVVYEHYGYPVYTGVPGRYMVQSAEVGLLTRNIVIQGANESNPLIGGHFIMFQTAATQFIQGVELFNMGQQGNLGRYPLHVHMCLEQSGTTISKNTVRNSKQRGIVIHGSNSTTVIDNVAWNNTGHIFFMEDGMEMNNLFFNNLGIATVAPQILLQKIVDGALRTENDDQPSLFWAPNPNNIWQYNAGIGGTFGFWFFLDFVIGGTSAHLPGASSFFPPIYTPLGTFENNVAHSNFQGVGMYRNGYRPIYLAYFRNVTAYKNDFQGVQFHGSNQLVLIDSIVADSTQNVDFSSFNALAVRNSIIMGYSANVGNPVFCGTVYLCVPAAGCPAGFNFRSVPARPGSGWRTVAPSSLNSLRDGVNLAANMASGNTFVNYDNGNCYPRGGSVGWDNRQGFFQPVSSNVNTSRFVNNTVNRFTWSQAKSDKPITYIAYDADGTLSGTGRPTFLVPNFNTNVLPNGTINSPNCRFNTNWNAYACTDVCYRSVLLQFNQPGVYQNGQLPPNSQIGYVTVRRQSDGAVQTVVEYFPSTPYFDTTAGAVIFPRSFTFNVATGYPYYVSFGNMTGTPARYWLSFADSTTYFIPGNSYPTPPGPPCTAVPTIFLPTTSAAARKTTDSKNVSMFSIPTSQTNAALQLPAQPADIGPAPAVSAENAPIGRAMPHPSTAEHPPAPVPAPAAQRGVPGEANVQARVYELMTAGTHDRPESEAPGPLGHQETATNRAAFLQTPLRYAEPAVFGPPLNVTLNVNAADIPDPFGNITTISSQYPSPPPSFLVQPLPVVG